MLDLYPSTIDLYLSCGHAYRLKHIIKQPPQVSLPALVGASFHKVIAMDAVAYAERKQFVHPDALNDAGKQYLGKLMGDNQDRLDLKGEPVELAYQDGVEYLRNLISRYVVSVRQTVEYTPTSTETPLVGTFDCSGLRVAVRGRADVLSGPTLWEFKAKKAQGRYYKGAHDGNIQVNTYLMLMEAAGIKDAGAVLCCVKPNKAHISNRIALSNRSRTRTALLIGEATKGINSGVFLPAVQDETKSVTCEYCDYNKTCVYTLYKVRKQGGIPDESE